MHEEITIPELTEVVARVTAVLGPREGSVVQLEGGITNRNFRVKFGGTDYVVRLPGKRTEILGIDRTAECIANKAAAGMGFAPGVAAMFEEPPCLVTLFIDGRQMQAEELRAPEVLAQLGRDLRQFDESGTELPTGFDLFRLVEEYAESGRGMAPSRPRGTTRPSGSRTGSRRRSGTSRRTRPRPRTTTCSRRTSCSTATGSS